MPVTPHSPSFGTKKKPPPPGGCSFSHELLFVFYHFRLAVVPPSKAFGFNSDIFFFPLSSSPRMETPACCVLVFFNKGRTSFALFLIGQTVTLVTTFERLSSPESDISLFYFPPVVFFIFIIHQRPVDPPVFSPFATTWLFWTSPDPLLECIPPPFTRFTWILRLSPFSSRHVLMVWV